MKRYILFASLLMLSAQLYAESLQPMLAHVHGRHPDMAVQELRQTAYFGPVFMHNLATYHSLERLQVESMLERHAYNVCRFDGIFESDGLYVGNDVNDVEVGTITRAPYEGELFACNDNGTLLWSGTCGNAIKKQRGTVVVLVAQKKPACVPKVHEHKGSMVNTAPAVGIGRIYIGEETNVTKFSSFTYTDCKE